MVVCILVLYRYWYSAKIDNQTVSLGENYVRTICGDVYEELIYTYEVCETTSDNPYVDEYDDKDNETTPEEDKGDGSEDEYIEIDDNLKYDKYFNCLWGKLNSTGIYKQTIETFDKDAKYHLKFRKGTLKDCGNRAGTVACTDDKYLSSTGEIIVHLVSFSEPKLEFASTILHEGIHAELYRFVYQAENGEIDPNDRPRLMQLYLYYKGLADRKEIRSGEVATRTQHDYMAENFVKPIAKAIRSLDNNRYPLDSYMGFGWQGLKNTYHFNSRLSDTTQKDYENKKNLINKNTNVGCD